MVDTPGGRIHVQWDHQASATPNSQLTFFAEFLAATGVYSLLGILAGHNRYAHIAALRSGAVSPHILGMNKIISEDAPRTRPPERPAKLGLAQAPASGQRTSRTQDRPDTGHRHHHQAPVRQTGRRPGQLQPQEARAPQPRTAHLLGGQLASGARYGRLPWQRTQRRQSPPWPDACARATQPRAAPQVGQERTRLWQRALHCEAGRRHDRPTCSSSSRRPVSKSC